MIIPVRGFTPKIGKDTYLAPNVTIVGDVEMGERCSVWFNAIIRGDVNSIRIGNEVNIQDAALIHATYNYSSTLIHDRASIGHSVILHGCEIGAGSLIGMGTIIMDHAKIPAHSLVGAGSLVTENAEFPEKHLIFGRPARAVRALTEEELKRIEKSADNYLFYKTWYTDTP